MYTAIYSDDITPLLEHEDARVAYTDLRVIASRCLHDADVAADDRSVKNTGGSVYEERVKREACYYVAIAYSKCIMNEDPSEDCIKAAGLFNSIHVEPVEHVGEDWYSINRRKALLDGEQSERQWHRQPV